MILPSSSWVASGEGFGFFFFSIFGGVVLSLPAFFGRFFLAYILQGCSSLFSLSNPLNTCSLLFHMHRIIGQIMKVVQEYYNAIKISNSLSTLFEMFIESRFVPFFLKIVPFFLLLLKPTRIGLFLLTISLCLLLFLKEERKRLELE